MQRDFKLKLSIHENAGEERICLRTKLKKIKDNNNHKQAFWNMYIGRYVYHTWTGLEKKKSTACPLDKQLTNFTCTRQVLLHNRFLLISFVIKWADFGQWKWKLTWSEGKSNCPIYDWPHGWQFFQALMYTQDKTCLQCN